MHSIKVEHKMYISCCNPLKLEQALYTFMVVIIALQLLSYSTITTIKTIGHNSVCDHEPLITNYVVSGLRPILSVSRLNHIQDTSRVGVFRSSDLIVHSISGTSSDKLLHHPRQRQLEQQKPHSSLFALKQDETTKETDMMSANNASDNEQMKILDDVPVYQNVVAKFLSNFMSSSLSTNTLDMNKVSDDDNDDVDLIRQRSEVMKNVLILQRTDEYWDQPKISKLPLDVLAQILDYEIYYKEWFVTGNVNPIYFSSTNFTFQDPDVKINTIQSYCTGVRRIFDYNTTARAEVLSTIVNPNITNTITCTWRLSGKVNIGPNGLMIKPYIVVTDYTIDEQTGLIIYQVDRFNIPSWDILVSAIFPFIIDTGIVSPPAPKPPRRYPTMPDISKYNL